jgi:manganese/iron transport system permease protein
VIEFLTGPWEYEFWQRAFLVAVMSGVVCGVIGSHVVLRGMAFIGDAVSHSVFPGVAVAFVAGFDLVIGGAVAGVVTACLVAVFSQNRRLKEDSVIGVFFAAAFGLGIVILSSAPGYSGSLESFLFGSILGISDGDVLNIAVIGGALLIAAFLLHKEFVAVTLDREMARSVGLPVFKLELALYVMVTLAIVISLQAVGNILVLALLITPAATARLLTDRLGVMMLLAPAIGALSTVVGLYLSYALDLAAGGLIVLVVTALFLLAWLLAPKHGLVPRLRAKGNGRLPEEDGRLVH